MLLSVLKLSSKNAGFLFCSTYALALETVIVLTLSPCAINIVQIYDKAVNFWVKEKNNIVNT